MSKKKSYMNKENILSEGLFDKILRSIIPKSIQKSVSKKYIEKKKKEISKIDKEISKHQKKIKQLVDKIRKNNRRIC